MAGILAPTNVAADEAPPKAAADEAPPKAPKPVEDPLPTGLLGAPKPKLPLDAALEPGAT